MHHASKSAKNAPKSKKPIGARNVDGKMLIKDT